MSASAAPFIIRELTPSRDLRALCVFAGVPFHAEASGYVHYESTGELPQIIYGGALAGGARAFELVRSIADVRLGPALDARARSAAEGFAALVRGDLADTEVWALYANDAHWSAVTRPTLLRAMHAPLAWFFVPRLRQRWLRHLDSRGVLDEAAARASALRAYGALADALATSGGPYLTGAAPSVADAVLWGHLAAVRHSPDVTAWVAAAAPSLVDYWARLRAGPLAAAAAPTGNAWEVLEAEVEARAESTAWTSAVCGAVAAPVVAPGDWGEKVRAVVATVGIFAVGVIVARSALKAN